MLAGVNYSGVRRDTGAPRRSGMLVSIFSALLFLALAALLVRSAWWQLVPWGFHNGDAADYLTIGKWIARGYAPYRDMPAVKPPMVFFLTAAGYRLFPNSPFGAGVVLLALLTAAGFAWYGIFRRLGATAPVAGLTASCLLALLLGTNRQWWLMTETLAFVFSSCALWFAMRVRIPVSAILSGAFIALASLAKQQVAADGFAVAFLLVWGDSQWRIRRLASGVLSGLSAYLLVCGILLSWGCLREAAEGFLFEYAYGRDFYSGSLFRWPALLDCSYSIPLALFAVGWCAGVWRTWAAGGMRRSVAVGLGLAVWWLGAFVAAAGVHSHYAVLLWAPTAFAIGVGCPILNGSRLAVPAFRPFAWVVSPMGAIQRKLGRTVTLAGIILAMCIGVFAAGVFFERRLYFVPAVVGHLNRRYTRDDTVFVLAGESGWYLVSLDMRPVCRTSLCDLARPGLRPSAVAEIMGVLDRTPPVCVLIEKKMHPHYASSEGYQELDRLLRRFVRERGYQELDLGQPDYDVFAVAE